VRLVSAERIGGGLSADGMGELSKLLLGTRPAKALGLAVDTGVFAELLPELEPDDFAVVQASADAGDPLAVRLGALLRGLDAETTRAVLRRLRYPTQLVRRVAAAVEGRPGTVPDTEPLTARRALARYGEETALDVARLRLAAGDDSTAAWLHAIEQASDAPHRTSDLAIDGSDLMTLGLAEGPRIGEVLATLLARVVEDPALNTRERLIDEARGLL
jgi:tRNA nucleotidyltransferase/poly(A) polymerase